MSQAAEQEFRRLYASKGLEVSESTDNSQTYKAEGIVSANILELLAVIADVPRRKEWVENLADTRIVAGDIATAVTIYERMHLPWPFADRDSLVRSTIAKDYQKLIVDVAYHDIEDPAAPPIPGVIRLPRVVGSFHFRAINDSRTFCRLIIHVDLGGQLPEWLVAMVVKKIPEKTLAGLLSQVEKTRGQYEGFIAEQKMFMKR